MSKKSNRNGRAFEAIVFYDLVNQLRKSNINFSITERGLEYHKQDLVFFNELSEGDSKDIKLRDDYISNINILTEWLFKKFSFDKSDFITLDKLPDGAGKDGDITDIRIIITKNKVSENINLSLKNNSNALKHSRIAGIPQWLGISEDSSECKEYLLNYNKIWKDVMLKIENYNLTATNKVTIYNQLEYISKNFKVNEIYNKYYNLIEEFFNNFCSTAERTNQLFRYLIGTIKFYKVINKPKKFIISDYINIKSPTKVTFSRNVNNYLLLTFDNGWKISIRLHNGDKRLSPSLKVDAQLDSTFKVPEIELKK